MSEEFAILLVQEGDSPRNIWELDKQETIIGRGDDCDVIVNDRQSSRHHAKIVREDERYKLLDLNSKNGTFLNGTPISTNPQYLNDGDQIGIALSSRLVFVDAGATAPLFVDNEIKPEIRMDQAAKRVWVMGKELSPPLSLAQYRLLELLFSKLLSTQGDP